MRIEDRRRFEMLVRVADFGGAHADLFPADSLGGQMFAAARTAASALGEHGAAEMSSLGAVREGVRARDAARGRLLTVLETIRRTARALAIDMPGVDSKFRLPSTHGSRALAMAARACAQDAHALSAPLVAHGLPPTFLNDIDEAVQAFETAIHAHAGSRAALVASRAGVQIAMQAGLTAVQRLDAIVPNGLHDDPATSAVWQQARYVIQPPRARNSSRKAAPPPAPATPAAPVTTQAG